LVPEKASAIERCEPPSAKMSPPPALYGYIVVDSGWPQQVASKAVFINPHVVVTGDAWLRPSTGMAIDAGV
jgi:hypothetical protein